MKLIFIRHGMTEGNLLKKYIGRKDEDLSEAGNEQLKNIVYPECDMIFCSPMKRCVHTAEIIYPDREYIIRDGFRECDFGDFEGKSYLELSDSEDYKKWIESGGTMRFPNGESPDGFRERCRRCFEETVGLIVEERSAAFVVHGGTIMSVFEKYAVPHTDYFDVHTENGHGYICEYDKNKKTIEILERI